MQSGIRILKRSEREASSVSNSCEGGESIKPESAETIVKGWVTALRERRRVEDTEYRRGFLRYDESLAVL
ncbi:MAG TPA: hypothetical protein VI306_15280 [Pyrinomonadaceae bacterium]